MTGEDLAWEALRAVSAARGGVPAQDGAVAPSDIFSDTVIFKIDRIACPFSGEGGVCGCMRNDGDGEVFRRDGGHGEADTVHCDGTFFHDQSENIRSRQDGVPDCGIVARHASYGSGPVNMARHDMPSESCVRSHGPLQIDAAAISQAARGGAV